MKDEDWDWISNIFSKDEIEELEEASDSVIQEDSEGVTVVMSFTDLQAKEIILHYLRSRASGNPVSHAYTEAFLGSMIAILKGYLDEK